MTALIIIVVLIAAAGALIRYYDPTDDISENSLRYPKW